MYLICKCPPYLEYMFSSNITVWDWGLMLFSLLLRKLLRLLQRHVVAGREFQDPFSILQRTLDENFEAWRSLVIYSSHFSSHWQES